MFSHQDRSWTDACDVSAEPQAAADRVLATLALRPLSLAVRATSPMSYFDEARARAKRRRSPWNLLLIPAFFAPWALLWYASARVLRGVARHSHPELNFVLLPDSAGGILMAIGLLFAWFPIAMVVANLLVTAIPTARRALDNEARGVPGTDLVSANRGLLKAAAFMTPAGWLIAVVGVVVS